MSRRHPYAGMPDYQFWKNEPGIVDAALFDPVTRTSFTIDPADPVVTAGSCFAQHVARHLAGSGFNFLVTERAHPLVPPEIAARFNYGLFTARYGNIYTARQLKQLLQRAYALFEPVERLWTTDDGQLVDPFRPQIHPGGFASENELLGDREVHFAALREAIESMAVFVFTLGLTETWVDTRDGAVFPLAPGVAGGRYDPAIFAFESLSVENTVDDLRWSIDFIRQRNPNVRVLLTVSPVPLNATAVDRHVFVSTTYSKAVLRIAAEQVSEGDAACDYFPSYEIITSPYARGAYFAPDCREVLDAGVQHVMKVFLRHYGRGAGAAVRESISHAALTTHQHLHAMREMVDVLCDEERISNA